MPIDVLKCGMAIWNALFIYTFICASCDGGAVDIICTKYIYFYRFLGWHGDETQAKKTDRFFSWVFL